MTALYQMLLDQAEQRPDKPYLCRNTAPGISYSTAAAKAAWLADCLLRSGRFSRRPVLAALIRNAENLACLIWACLAAGICLAFLPENRHPEQTRQLMRRIDTDALVTDMDELQELSLSLPFAAPVTAAAVEPPTAGTGLHPSAFIFPTSGTTGEAKWVAVGHDQILKAMQGLRQAGGLEHAVDQTVYLTQPLSHSYGLSSLLEYTSAGGTIALPGGTAPQGPIADLFVPEFADSITAIEGSPFFHLQLAKLSGRIKLPGLRHIGFGGGALVPEVLERLRQVYPLQTCSIRYGLTETPSVVSQKIFTFAENEDRSSAGRVLPLYEFYLADESGCPVGPGQVGEIHLKGECLAWPYLGESGGADDFFATGDLGYVDAQGELHVVGRKSVYLEHGGFRISPEYVEAAAALHEGVADCQALNGDGRLRLHVVPRSGATVSAVELRRFLAERLPGYAVPDQVQWVEEIERTGSGKIRRIC